MSIRLRVRCIGSVVGILKVGHIWISPELILVVGCFKKYRIAYLRGLLLFPNVTLKSFPHYWTTCMKQSLAKVLEWCQ